jgi:hypothetical protein
MTDPNRTDSPSPAATEVVPLLDLAAQHAPLADEIHAAIEQVFASQHFIMGPAVERLEAALAVYWDRRSLGRPHGPRH